MFIGIDSKRNAILYKHASQRAVFDLSWLECPVEKIRVHAGAVENDFAGYTDKQLESLICNSGGTLPTKDTRQALLERLLAVVKALPFTECDEYEVHTQKRSLGATDKQRYVYAKGEDRPSVAPRNYIPQPIQALYNDGALVVVTTPVKSRTVAAAEPAQPRSSEAGTNAPATDKAAANREPVASKPSYSRTNIRPTVWEVANEVWEAAGKPKEASVILVLRKQMMTQLEELGVKRNTSSNLLGEWQKQVLSN